MAARRKTKTRRRRSTGIKLLNLGEAFVQANIVTQELMDVNPVQFVLGDAGPSLVASGGGISLLEIAKRPDLIGTIAQRAMNPEAIINIAVKSAIANIGFRFARRAVSRPVRMLNTQLRQLRLGVTL
jgi:hypothetical protein